MHTTIRRGLCSDCTRSGECALSSEKSGYIYYCDEYDNGNASLRVELNAIISNPPINELKIGNTQLPKGLCSTCSNVRHCQFNKPDSGVWYCEEYC